MSTDNPKDSIYSTPHDKVSPFAFDEKVARVFPDMIKRSVPGYDIILNMIGMFTRKFAQPGTACYDLGCSLGAVTLSIRHNLIQKECKIIAVDKSPAMVERCRDNIAWDASLAPVEVIEGDIAGIPIHNASIVVLNFTLQFIPPEERAALFKRICEGMVPGGILVLSEKVYFSDPTENEFLIDVHHDFKRLNGYSDLEISQKRQSLENVLVPDTVEDHLSSLSDAGFSFSTKWFQWFNFTSIIAQK